MFLFKILLYPWRLNLAYMFSLVYVSVELCLEGVFPYSVSTRQDSCVRVYAPLTLAPPSRKEQNRTGVTQLSTWTKWGAFELTHGSACIIDLRTAQVYWDAIFDMLTAVPYHHFYSSLIILFIDFAFDFASGEVFNFGLKVRSSPSGSGSGR